MLQNLIFNNGFSKIVLNIKKKLFLKGLKYRNENSKTCICVSVKKNILEMSSQSAARYLQREN